LETEPYYSAIYANIGITLNPISFDVFIAFVIVLFLLVSSALVSGSEVAYFSLSPAELNKLRRSKLKIDQSVIRLLGIPDRLLATILVANNFINIGIVIISAFITTKLFNFSGPAAYGFIIQVVIITFLLLFFGEILPKVYASRYAVKFSKLMAKPLNISEKIFRPINSFLIYSTSIVNKKFMQKRKNISIAELSDALELTQHDISEDKKILKGIVKFSNIYVKEIMKSRLDVVSVGITTKFKDLMTIINNSGYSRIPVYENTFDNIKGILYIKDLLPYIHKSGFFKWQSLIRPPYYIPESKKINDLLKEFQINKIHMAIVIDEYGGSSGIVTLEDILEEIVGEITDEYDYEESIYTKVDENQYIVEGKILLNDLYKILNIREDVFNDIKGEADTLAGLILELRGEIPRKGEKISYKNFVFKVISVDKRRIIKIHVTVNVK
jgi:putative hemolysin